MKTDREIVDSCNELARELLRLLGFCSPDGVKIYESRNPRCQLAWRMAVEAFDHIEGTDVDDALIEAREEEIQVRIQQFQFDPVI